MHLQTPSSSLAAIALGGNLSYQSSSPRQIVETALQQLTHNPSLSFVAVSSWYQTVAVGPPQPDYINGCALVEIKSGGSLKTPEALLDLMLATEQQFGRRRRQRWGPRTLDLDLLLYDAVVLRSDALTLPHPRMAERAFVLVPLAEILPNWVDPITGLTVRQLRDRVDCTGVSRLSP